MPRLSEGSSDVLRIDKALSHWQQGDFALNECWFVHMGNSDEPLTDAAADDENPGIQPIASKVEGLMVVTQTCDLVRSCLVRPYVEVAPLVQIESTRFHEVQRGQRPNYATLSTLKDDRFAADLDRIMTIEKSLVAGWERTIGCVTDDEARHLAGALARKRMRKAFPDDFTDLARPLVERMIGKHKKQSPEGAMLQALQEIRVTATPDWNAHSVSLTFWFIRDPELSIPENADSDVLLEQWLDRVQAKGRYSTVEGLITTLEDMTAAEFVGSDLLDLDHLSIGNRAFALPASVLAGIEQRGARTP